MGVTDAVVILLDRENFIIPSFSNRPSQENLKNFFLSSRIPPTYLACSLKIPVPNIFVFCLIPKIFQFLGNTRHPPLCIHFTGERPRTEPLQRDIPAQSHSRASRIDSSRFLLPGREPVTPGTYVEPLPERTHTVLLSAPLTDVGIATAR